MKTHSIEIISTWIDDFRMEVPGKKPVAVPFELRPVILGMVSKESTFNSKNPRFEAKYDSLVSADAYAKKLGISLNTEIALQRFSYGLLQIMGANCRALGFAGNLVDLFHEDSAELTFKYGLRFFMNQLERYKGNVEKALVAYNRGHIKYQDGIIVGVAYADDIFDRSKKFTGAKTA